MGYISFRVPALQVEGKLAGEGGFTGTLQTRHQDMQAGASEDELMALYEAKIPVLLENLNNAVTGYIKAHPDQDAAAALSRAWVSAPHPRQCRFGI